MRGVVACLAFLGLAAGSAHGWIQTLEGDGNLNLLARDVLVDAAGDVYVGGRLRLPSQQFRFVVVKFDGDSGAELWRYQTGGATSPNGQSAASLALDGSGDVVGVGVVSNAPNTHDMFVVKLDGGTGAEVWSFQPSTIPDSDEGYDIAVDSSGDVVAAGEVDQDYYVAKLDGATGALVWSRHGEGTKNEVVFDAVGNAIAGGRLFDGASINWVIDSFDGATGADVWQFTLTDAEAVRDLLIDPGGDVIAAGDADRELAVVKLDAATGALLWQHDAGIGRSAGFAAAVDAAGDVFVAGQDDLPSADFVAEKLSGTTGAVLWQVVRDGTAPVSSGDVDGAFAVAVGPSGDAFFGGQLDSDTSAKDAVVLRLDGATGAEEWIQRLDGSHAHEDRTEFLDRIHEVVVGPSGDVVAIGEFQERNRAYDFLAVKLDADDGSMAGLFGTKLIVKDRGPSKRSIVGLLKSDYIQSPPPGTPHDPRTAGGMVRIWNPSTLEEATFALPAGPNWQALGTPAGAKGYRYNDKLGLSACKNVTILRNKKLKVTCKSKFGPIPFSLDEPSQGSLAISVQMGDAAPQCAEFGGLVITDEPEEFKAKAAAGAVACP